MDFNSLQEPQWKEKLKCTTCNNYLSHFPIYISSSNENICGRCYVTEEECLIRNEVFEVVSQDIKFPCRYHSEGCYEKLVPKHIPAHEALCPYQTRKCPTRDFTKCNVEISYQTMIKHCHTNHADLFLKNGRFDVDLSKSSSLGYFLEHDNELVVISMKFEKEEKVFQIVVGRKGKGKIEAVYPYELKFRCGKRELSITYEATSQTSVKKISLDSVLATEQKVASMSVTVFIGEKGSTAEAEKVNEHLVNLFKCSFCSEYLIKRAATANTNPYGTTTKAYYVEAALPYYHPPQYHTQSDSSCCSKCNRPCGPPSLETLRTLLTLPCKNAKEGCQFTSKLDELQDHHNRCRFSAQTCPLKDYTNCTWSGLGLELNSHFLAKHQNMLVQSSIISENYLQNRNVFYNKPSKSYLLRFAHFFFHLVFWHEGQQYKWAMEILGEFKDGFRYEIEMLNNENGKKVMMSNSCSKQSSKNQLLNNFNEHCCLSQEQFQRLTNKSKQFQFEVRIFKK